MIIIAKIEKFLFETFLKSIIFIFTKIGLARWTEKIPRNKIANRTLVLIDQAPQKNIKIEVLKFSGKITKIFRANFNGRKIIFESLPLGNSFNKISQTYAENKWLTKIILKKYKLPVPEGQVFAKFKKATKFVAKVGFPVVTKPLHRSQCDGVTINIRTFKKFKKAFLEAKKFGRKVLVEKFIEGQNFRALVIAKKLAAVCLRECPNIVGDGVNTIDKLIRKKNSQKIRGTKHQLNYTLHQIQVDKKYLQEQGYHLQDILLKNQKLYLSEKINLSSGADIYDVTDQIHPKNKKLLEKIAQCFDAQILGIDFIAKDLKKIFSSKNFAIIETNTLPYIDMHYYPLKGKPRLVAKQIWEMAFKQN